MEYTKEEQYEINKLSGEILIKLYQMDRSGRLLYLFVKKLSAKSRMKAFGIKDEYSPFVVSRDEYKKINSGSNGENMKISELQLKRICFQEKFYTLYELKEDVPIVLNDLYVYAIKNDEVYATVDFDIFTNTKGTRYISPRYNPSHCDYFLLTGERLAMCKTIEIKANDYIDVAKFNGNLIDVTKYNGNFTFVLEDNK